MYFLKSKAFDVSIMFVLDKSKSIDFGSKFTSPPMIVGNFGGIICIGFSLIKNPLFEAIIVLYPAPIVNYK
jgi:hypothetical protein